MNPYVCSRFICLLLCCAARLVFGVLSCSLSHHEEREVAIAEQVEDHERDREKPEPQDDVHVLLLDGTHDPGHSSTFTVQSVCGHDATNVWFVAI